MRNLLLASLLLAACGSNTSSPAQPLPAHASPDTWKEHTLAFFSHFESAFTANRGDCAKIVAAVEHLAPQAKTLRAELEAGHHRLKELANDPALDATGQKIETELHDLSPHCKDNEELSRRLEQAFDATLFTVQPLFEG
jgi:hypothetical protein